MPTMPTEKTSEALEARLRDDHSAPPPLPDARTLDPAAWRAARAAAQREPRAVVGHVFDGILASAMTRPEWARAAAVLRGGRVR
jgi:hypothetical protein